MRKKADIIIIGGGVIGSSVAYNLLNDGYDGAIIVLEKDPMYEFSSTPRSAGGIRQLFTTSINIQISRYSLQKYKTFPTDMAIHGETAEIDFKQRGYLFLAKDENVNQLKKQCERQRQFGVPSDFLTPQELLTIIPELTISDLQGGLYCEEDGYLDPYSVMQGYAKKAKHLGATYIYEEVDTILKDNDCVTGIQLANGESYYAPIVINCAGPWAAALSEKIALPLPIVPLKRQIIQFDIEEPLHNNLPLTVDPTGVYFRHEGKQLISGYSEQVKPGIDFSWRRSFFLEQLWPVLGHRISNFECAKIRSGWAGMYSFNTIDQNAIIGEHPKLNGYYTACGFSGHGMQQAPAVGKGLSELIRLGKYESLNLHPLRFERFQEKELLIEGAIV
ncbi:MAG: NAD(P)/FAD-dependent oxidoreductase [Bacillota bacterium]|uniref:FAD-binding oxidoreductase n=1 Tax=Virgibacillus salarius TaxID=447199 RepID=A0A941IBN4_9BACI|nr:MULTISPECIES: FAD-binding oxidoreductase [Bacillaceae]MBR7796577.1 FAD-binding oxidoreductase [Virgibacillus salarius]NAZ09286.1 FAD-dependent oxidoreductase [Agaribacter marinus]MCC2250902.1 FAD-binding oxidoreductase [Virgibacillus sp. AGTR]MDY7042588.1 FAD-binding oxidoreductase [Virgibacillus sp. M23]QRZ17057.1 FAD-binding oxidoreductase [Virgibacillus sp. AGTR]